MQKIVVILIGREEDVPKEFRSLPAKYAIICDPSPKLADELNAVWAQRYYVYDDAMRLVYRQMNPDEPLRDVLKKGGR